MMGREVDLIRDSLSTYTLIFYRSLGESTIEVVRILHRRVDAHDTLFRGRRKLVPGN